MGANDAAEMLEVAKAECARLERDLAEALDEVKRLVNLPAAVQQPNREALADLIHASHRNFCLMDKRCPEAGQVTDAILAALPIPATGEVEADPSRKRSYLAGIIHRAIPDDDSLAHLCQDDDCLWYDIADAILGSMSIASEAEIEERIRAARDEAWEECTRRFVELNPGIPVVAEVTP